jgi:hypothetical protein
LRGETGAQGAQGIQGERGADGAGGAYSLVAGSNAESWAWTNGQHVVQGGVRNFNAASVNQPLRVAIPTNRIAHASVQATTTTVPVGVYAGASINANGQGITLLRAGFGAINLNWRCEHWV